MPDNDIRRKRRRRRDFSREEVRYVAGYKARPENPEEIMAWMKASLDAFKKEDW